MRVDDHRTTPPACPPEHAGLSLGAWLARIGAARGSVAFSVAEARGATRIDNPAAALEGLVSHGLAAKTDGGPWLSVRLTARGAAAFGGAR